MFWILYISDMHSTWLSHNEPDNEFDMSRSLSDCAITNIDYLYTEQ